jgi:squalene-hopene/tetraprenyl-beta-curcumene cyclase
MLLMRHVLLRSVFLAATLLGWCLAVRAEQKPLFQERFSGKLSAGWTWVDELPGSWQLIDGSLDLKVVPVGEGLWAKGSKHPNLLLRDAGTNADFAVELHLKSKPTSRFEHAGVLLYFDGDNYVALNKEMLTKSEIVLVAEKAAKPTTRQKPYEHEEVYLRLVVAGKKVTGQYRHYDSDAWQTVGALDLPVAGPYRVGVFAGGPEKDTNHHVRLSDFRVLPVSTTTANATPNQPPAKEARAPTPTSTPARRPIRTDIPLEVQARQTAARAIPYITTTGTAWISERKCLSCHYSGYMLWSLRDAGQRGFTIDKGKLAESTIWAMSQPKGHGHEGAAQILIARDRSDRSEKVTKLIETLRAAIIKSQEKDGFWKPGGQLPDQKRPLSETTQVSTMLCVLALDSLDPPNEKAVEARDKALAWLKKTPPNDKNPAVSSEWYALRLLIEKKFGDPKQVAELRDKILSAQQPDGGWGWLWTDKSDAFGTGLSVYALTQAGVLSSHQAIQNAWKFLIETQIDDGSWVVNGTKHGTKSKPHPFSSFWGSTWALLGLSHSLPVTGTTDAVAPAAASASAEPSTR